jgi:hypothetical protein
MPLAVVAALMLLACRTTPSLPSPSATPAASADPSTSGDGPRAAAAATPAAEPGTWRTWVLASGSQFRLPPPPDAAATGAELERLRGLAAATGGDAEARERIAWWDAAAPSYRWNQIAVDAAIKAGLNNNMASRHLALLHTALADAMIAAWDSKNAHGRPRPAVADPTLPTEVPTPPSPSYTNGLGS